MKKSGKNVLEEKISKSNTRKNRAKKIALITGLGLMTTFNTGCGSSDSDLTKLSKKYDDKVENVANHKEELKDLQEEAKEIQEEIKEKQQEIIEDQNDANTIRIELQKAKVNPPE